MHRVIVVGRLGADPKVFKDTVAKFGIASDEMGKTTMWFNAVAFKGSFGEKFWGFITGLKKGDSVFADGNLKEGEYEDKNGEKKKTMDYILTSISYASSGKKADGDKPKEEALAAAGKPAPKSEAPKKSDEEEEQQIPF